MINDDEKFYKLTCLSRLSRSVSEITVIKYRMTKIVCISIVSIYTNINFWDYDPRFRAFAKGTIFSESVSYDGYYRSSR